MWVKAMTGRCWHDPASLRIEINSSLRWGAAILMLDLAAVSGKLAAVRSGQDSTLMLESHILQLC